MDQETVGNVVLLAIVTLISVIQNGFFAHKVEHESKTQNGRSFQRTGTLAFERVYTANQNCVDAYPTFLVMLWSAGLLCSQGGRFERRLFVEKTLPDLQLGSGKLRRVPAAFAGLMYLFVRQKYFVGYLGERRQSTPGYIFGKRIILFLFLMSLAGIFNYYLILFFGSDFENYIKTITTTISPLLLIP
ncbi:arachidonate 5-lipoxygenase-activating protein isoform X1 [Equus przewalskii]|uniref:Arachidonate 5-lipoxygenase-activating protein n=2 Tax=Equus TaxID=9789 RepID=A0A3Q2HEW0_HORSE|nr:arachidonate 5-lipoxygenase-activating protein isoform X1 [Equus caballus]XP_008515808.1 PREDICTED: arachidonate 5-lipoxygenase-activating protein isoform X3 [Equus przewalskii]